MSDFDDYYQRSRDDDNRRWYDDQHRRDDDYRQRAWHEDDQRRASDDQRRQFETDEMTHSGYGSKEIKIKMLWYIVLAEAVGVGAILYFTIMF